MFEGLIGHYRTEIRTTNADIDDVPDGFAGVALPLSAADAVRKICHFAKHRLDLRHHVFVVHHDDRIPWGAQSHMQDRPFLGGVHIITTKNSLNLCAQTGLLGQLQEQLERCFRDAIFGIVQEQSHSLGGKSFASSGVFREEPSQGKLLDLLAMLGQRFPSRAFDERFDVLFHGVFTTEHVHPCRLSMCAKRRQKKSSTSYSILRKGMEQVKQRMLGRRVAPTGAHEFPQHRWFDRGAWYWRRYGSTNFDEVT